ncbi:hypothetical protein LLG96_06930 [bacterium]|nr:hypothetical protein [bacterium]
MILKAKKYSLIVMLGFVLIFHVQEVNARYNPGVRWRTVGNDRFTVYYPEGREAFARRVLSLGDEVYGDVTGYFGVRPRKVPIILNSDTDLLNGFYSAFPNRMSLFESPGSDLKYFGSSTGDVIDLVFTHEFTHFVHITTRRGWYGALTRILGDGLAVSNAESPGWALEGITTNLETKFTTGGRGRSPLFRSTVLSYARDRRLWGMSAAGTEAPYKPPAGRIYHSGLFMVDYLNRMYGEDAFARLSSRQAAHPFGGTGSALKRITKKSPRAFYREYRESVTSMADSLRDVVESKGLPAGKTVIPAGLDGCVSYFWTPQGTIMAVMKGYDRKTMLLEMNPGTGEKITETPLGRMAENGMVRRMPGGRLVFAEVYFHPLGQGELDVSDLVVLDPGTGNRERLTRDSHIVSADISPDGKTFAALRRNGMWLDLVLIDSDGSGLRTLVSEKGCLWESPRWSPDGKTIAVTAKVGSLNTIALVDPRSGSVTPLINPEEYGFGDPSYSPDGRWLVFTSSRDGLWNIFALDLETRRLFQLTSVFTAALEPGVSPDGRSLSFMVHSGDFSEVRTIPFDPQNGREVTFESADRLPEPDLARLEPVGEFKGNGIPLWEAYKPFIHIPYAGITADEKGTQAGLYFMGCDPLLLNFYGADVRYGLESNRFYYDVSLSNRSFWPIINARLYDVSSDVSFLRDSNDFWNRERGGELSISLDVLHRYVPELVASSVDLGACIRKFSSLEDTVSIDRARDFSPSFFGDVTIMRLPDYAPRDMVPGWGQALFVYREQAVKAFHGELPGHNQVVVAKQYLPSPFRHHGFELSLLHQEQSGRVYDRNVGLAPRGYEDAPEGGLKLRKTLTFTMEYRFPLIYTDRGLGVNMLHFNLLRGSFFTDHGAGWSDSFDPGDWGRMARTSVGVTLTAQMDIISFFPLETGVAWGYKIREKENFLEMVFVTPITDIAGMNRFPKRILGRSVFRWMPGSAPFMRYR